MIRVLQIFNKYLKRGGEEAAVEKLTEQLPSPETLELQNCFFSSEEITAQGMSPLRQAQLMWRNPVALRQLLDSHARFQPDCWLLHNVFPTGSAAIYHEAIRRDVPCAYLIHNFRPFSVSGYLWAGDRVAQSGLRKNFWPEIWHGSWQESQAKTAFFAAVLWMMHLRRWFRCIRSWIAISDFMKQSFVRAGIPAEDIFVVPHFWIPQNTGVTPPEAEEDYYLFLGRLIPQKGVRTLLQAWDILEGQLGSGCPRLVIGGQGPLEDEVVAATRRSSKIAFHGEVSGPAKTALIRGCRAMLAPSLWWEPLGLVTYEAYDFAKPILAAESGGLTEMVFHGETGMHHEPGRAAQLAEHIRELDSSAPMRQRLGQAGRRWLLDNTSVEVWRERMIEALKHAAGRLA